MPNITRLLATAALSCSLTAAAAPSSVMPKPDANTATSAKAVIAHSARPGSGMDCSNTARQDREQRADRLATLMMRHSMVSRLVPGRDIAESAGEAVSNKTAQRHDETPHSCS